jgi:hypothetical protein
VVKENQKTLLGSLQALDFSQSENASTTDCEHGRIEERKIEVISRTPNMDLSFPYIEQIFRLQRIRMDLCGKILSEEVVYGITSASRKKHSPQDLLAGIRGHWAIENCEHYVRDVTFHEDRCRIRLAKSAQLFSIFRNLCLNVLRLLGFSNIAKGIRTFAYGPKALAIRVLGVT